MGALTIVLLIIIIFALLAIIYISIYNNLKLHQSKIEKVEGLIDNDLRLKYDTIMKADEVFKKNFKSKKDYFKEFDDLKTEKISNFDLERKLITAEQIINNLCSDHNSLEKDEEMKDIIRDLKNLNEKITAGISFYNNHTNTLNTYIRKFPNNLIAKIHHIKIKPFFDGKDMTDLDTFDFKL